MYRGADGVILLYDICDRNTFKNLSKWKADMERMNSKLVYVLVGTKCDLEEKRSVSCEEGQVCVYSLSLEDEFLNGIHDFNALINVFLQTETCNTMGNTIL
jgi:GTPase SAR1 family protein